MLGRMGEGDLGRAAVYRRRHVRSRRALILPDTLSIQDLALSRRRFVGLVDGLAGFRHWAEAIPSCAARVTIMLVQRR